MPRELETERKKQDEEQFARLTAPQHAALFSFTEHRRVEGLSQREGEDHEGSDRLLALESLHGSLQLGYDPRRAQSFLFARVKTSALDTAASAHQHSLSEEQMRSYRKRGNENRLFTARRRADSAALLYKAERKPWTAWSLRPYLYGPTAGALRKTMPFLDRAQETQRRAENRERKKRLEREAAEALRSGDNRALAEARAGERALSSEQNTLGALLAFKQQRELLFFRKVNYAFDIQKARMFEFYREQRARRIAAGEERETAPAENPEQDGSKQK